MMWWKKLKQIIVKDKNTNADAGVEKITADEREKKIDYYRNLFRLSFRVYNKKLINIEEYDSEYGSPSGFNGVDEDEIKYFYETFKSLNALDVFYQEGLSYCKDQLSELRKQIAEYQALTDSSAQNQTMVKDERKKKGKQQPDPVQQLAMYEKKLRFQKDVQQQMKAIKKHLLELGCEMPTSKKKTTLIKSVSKPDVGLLSTAATVLPNSVTTDSEINQ